MKVPTLRLLNCIPFLPIQGRFQDTTIQKLKFCQTFLGIEPVPIDLQTPNIEKAIGFYHPKPSPNFSLLHP